MSNSSWTDPIVEEVRRIRDEYAAQFNYDLEAICLDLKDREARGEFSTVRRPPRRPAPVARTGT
ncbi:hypothetical protein BH24GEM3_BH24GEM3_04650 [soil metagenome]